MNNITDKLQKQEVQAY